MAKQAGVWIDQAKVHAVLLDDDKSSARTITSDVEGHRKGSGHAGTPLPGHLGGGTGDRLQRRRDNQLRRYYDRVCDLLSGAEQVLILGPGEAPAQLRKRLEERGLDPSAVVVRASDKKTDRELTATVKAHFGRSVPRREP